MTQLFPVRSDPTVNFLPALAAAGGTLTPPFTGGAINNLYGLPSWGSRWCLVRAISYVAVENIGLEFDFWAKAAGNTGVIGTQAFLSRYQFTKANGVQFNGAGLYNYYVDGLAIPYLDLDTVGSLNPPTLHVAIQNVDTVAKSANAAGAVACTFWVEPMTAVQG